MGSVNSSDASIPTTATSSVTASRTRAPVLLRPRNFQWYWNSSSNPWSSSSSVEPDNWQKYSDIENEVIEDAFNEKKEEVELDVNYVVSLEHQVQYHNTDKTRQRPIKRVQLKTDRSNVHLRDDRFAVPVTLATMTTATTSKTKEEKVLEDLRTRGDLLRAYDKLVLREKNINFADILEDAAGGILVEGAKIGKEREAQWLAKQLLDVKHFSQDQRVNQFSIPQPIGETCVYLYTKESFWYKLLNSCLRNHQTMTLEQVKTLGPFCWLLRWYINKHTAEGKFAVYRGLNLTDEQRKEFMKERDYWNPIKFTSFTSTSGNRKLAERFGNTLLIFDLKVKSKLMQSEYVEPGMDVSHLSDFPNEEEYTMPPGSQFHFIRSEYDNETKKHIIHLEAEEWQ
ncbi:unnamed protein product [Didymodactylos carnosus]|uniref:NAD(P)(+)--arginine ADP-ribosyltransferase n=1 Tax=Didymodactylos carnosus TaxID=1234261 RepID=A0A815PUI9_9BILA|nr:unnamed protein product [Didymodactylos carnosus]CAF1453511.1 unnamed protein product [Didymodactylos carnosus]CAF4173360.1 unnamed protein product [Didymodactylos carnosus]CAF4326136.1 unnamed protein product [Didymodactylos carnosus]